MVSMARKNPPAVPADTTQDVWERQMAAIARRSVADRLAEWEELNRSINRRAEDAVRRRHPDYDDDEVLRSLVRQRHGDELTVAVWPGLDLLEP